MTNDPKLIAKADKIVFPGVGAMRDCMQGMRDAGIDEVVRHAAFNKPVLAICVGMQALLERSEENGGADALGIFEGVVKHFPDIDGLKVPHMGWNQVHQGDPSHPMWNNIEQDARFILCIVTTLSQSSTMWLRQPVTMVWNFVRQYIKTTCLPRSSTQKKSYRRLATAQKLCGMEHLNLFSHFA